MKMMHESQGYGPLPEEGRKFTLHLVPMLLKEKNKTRKNPAITRQMINSDNG
jgi:hypothetical protein